MSQTSQLIEHLKRELRRQGLTYAWLAKKLKLSESSVKRMFSKRSFSLTRLEQICGLLGLEISDLVELMGAERATLTELSPEQEAALLAEPKLLLMTYLLINGWQIDDIVENFAIEKRDAQSLLIRLHRARIIELLPLNRVKLLTARNFTWRKDGPIQQFFAGQVQQEFLDSTFTGQLEVLRFVGGMLSQASLVHMQQVIDRIAREFDELSRRDSALPLSERHGCSAVFAIRPWEFSMFAKLRRKR